MNDILDTIQASEEEVQQYLQLIEAYKIEGKFKLIVIVRVGGLFSENIL